MPELPEIETIRRDLAGAVLQRRVTHVHVLDPALVRAPDPGAFVAALEGRTLREAGRRGKYLLVGLDDGLTWAMHLSLEGRLLLVPADAAVEDGTRLAVVLDDGRALRLWDKVSYATTAVGDAPALAELFHLDRLGPEPTAPGFTRELFRERFAARRVMVKPTLLDQRVVAGVGNIYADESLWRARVHPTRKANALTDAEWTSLHRALVDVMAEAVSHRGTSAPGGLYRDLYGRKGEHQAHLSVFRRAGKPCPRCATTIVRTEVGGRATFHCPACQRPDAARAARDERRRAPEPARFIRGVS